MVLKFSTTPGLTMATMNFSVPEDVKQAFNAEFDGQNKSAVLTRLLREAVQQAQQQREREAAGRRILARRASSPIVEPGVIDRARKEGRP
jgi:hypothetical protein